MDESALEAHRQQLQELSEDLKVLYQIVNDAMTDAEQRYLGDIVPEMRRTEDQALKVAESEDSRTIDIDGLSRVYGMHKLRADQCIKNWEIFQNLLLAISAAESLWKRRLTASTVVTNLRDLMRKMGGEIPSSNTEVASAAEFQQWSEQTDGSVQGLLTSLTALVTESTVKDLYLPPELALENNPDFDRYREDFKNSVLERVNPKEKPES